MERIALVAIAAPRRIIVVATLMFIAAGIIGAPVATRMSAAGFQDPTSESARATALLADKFDQGDMPLVILVTAPDGARGRAATATAAEIAGQLNESPYAGAITSAWAAPPGVAGDLISRDGKSGLIVAGITGGEKDAQHHASELSARIVHDRDGVAVQTGGMSMVYAELASQAERDLLVMEGVAIPLSFLVLVWVFGGLLAAALPCIVGVVAIVGTLFVLRLFTLGADVSIFALNLTAATGLALGIDYTLLLISRYRDELAAGEEPDRALVRTMCTAGRTVLFSACVVALAMATMALFPMYFLKSFAYSGVAAVVLTALSAIVLTPAVIVLLGPRLDALDVRRLARRLLRKGPPTRPPVAQMFWYRWTKFVMRRALPLGLAVVVLLLALGTPFLKVQWGFRDDRALPSSASAHQVGDRLRTDFSTDLASEVKVVVPDAAGLRPEDVDRYCAALSQISDVTAVSAPTGTCVSGAKVGPPTAATGLAAGSLFLTVRSSAPLYSAQSQTQLDRLHAVAGPGDRPVELTGLAQINRDSVHGVTSRLPLVLGLIGVFTLVVMFLLTGSLVMPVKTLILNLLSLTAAFGAMVWIFQESHLGGLGTAATGTLDVNIPMLLFCIAFGLSMDYEVFLISRIREYWLLSRSVCPDGDNDESVALGLAHTGKVITAAAVVMSISFAALIASQVSFMRMFGLGLTIAVLVDATLVRMVLVPAFMHVFGRWNWWAPAPLARLHDRIGIRESVDLPASAQRSVPAVDAREGPELTS